MTFPLSFTATLIICFILGLGTLLSIILFFVVRHQADKDESFRYGMRALFLTAFFAIFLVITLFYPVCPNCSKHVNTDYCTHCGQMVEENIVPVCPQCGCVCRTDFCGECGTPMNQED